MTSYTTTVDLNSRTLAQEIYDRADDLEARVLSFTLGQREVTWPKGLAKSIARSYVRGLQKRDRDDALELLNTLVDRAEVETDAFWGSELGRALFACDAYNDVSMSRTRAQAVLGLKARQRVHQLVVNGELEEEGDTVWVRTASVRKLFRIA